MFRVSRNIQEVLVLFLFFFKKKKNAKPGSCFPTLFFPSPTTARARPSMELCNSLQLDTQLPKLEEEEMFTKA